MATTLTPETSKKLDDKIAEILKFLIGFKSLQPGKEARLEYIVSTVGDAETYLANVMLLLRKIRTETKEVI